MASESSCTSTWTASSRRWRRSVGRSSRVYPSRCPGRPRGAASSPAATTSRGTPGAERACASLELRNFARISSSCRTSLRGTRRWPSTCIGPCTSSARTSWGYPWTRRTSTSPGWRRVVGKRRGKSPRMFERRSSPRRDASRAWGRDPIGSSRGSPPNEPSPTVRITSRRPTRPRSSRRCPSRSSPGLGGVRSRSFEGKGSVLWLAASDQWVRRATRRARTSPPRRSRFCGALWGPRRGRSSGTRHGGSTLARGRRDPRASRWGRR